MHYTQLWLHNYMDLLSCTKDTKTERDGNPLLDETYDPAATPQGLALNAITPSWQHSILDKHSCTWGFHLGGAACFMARAFTTSWGQPSWSEHKFFTRALILVCFCLQSILYIRSITLWKPLPEMPWYLRYGKLLGTTLLHWTKNTTKLLWEAPWTCSLQAVSGQLLDSPVNLFSLFKAVTHHSISGLQHEPEAGNTSHPQLTHQQLHMRFRAMLLNASLCQSWHDTPKLGDTPWRPNSSWHSSSKHPHFKVDWMCFFQQTEIKLHFIVTCNFARAVLLMILVVAKGGSFVLEQPGSSILEVLPWIWGWIAAWWNCWTDSVELTVLVCDKAHPRMAWMFGVLRAWSWEL